MRKDEAWQWKDKNWKEEIIGRGGAGVKSRGEAVRQGGGGNSTEIHLKHPFFSGNKHTKPVFKEVGVLLM